MTGKLLEAHLHDFLAITPLTRRYAETTIKNYRGWVRDFLNWFQEQHGETPSLTDYNEETIRAYRNWKLTQKSYRPRSANAIRAALLAFGDWLWKEGLLPANPAIVLELVPLDEPHRNPITSAEAFAMLAKCSRLADPYKRRLYQAVLSLMVHAGARESELHKITLKDVNLAQASVLVRRGKGGTRRTLFLCPTAVTILADYLAARLPAKTERFFVINRAQAAGYRTIRKIIIEAKALADIDPDRHFTVHSFRHDFLTRLGQNGGDVVSISKLAGHKNPSTTMNNYLHTDEARMRAVANLSETLPQPPEPPRPPDPVLAPVETPHPVRIIHRRIPKLRNQRRAE
jgi:site-specific recombinase XerD